MTSRVCVVTGSASGIGFATAARMLEAGWHVVGVDISERGLKEAEPVLRAISNDFHPVVGDVADTSVLEAASASATEIGPLLCWVNNAGYNVRGMIHEIDRATYQRGLDVVLGGVFWGTAVATRAMLGQGDGGSIVNISSVHGSVGYEGGWATYAMCKAGIDGLTRQIAADYGKHGIRCNSIAPGLIETSINADLFANLTEEGREEVAQSSSPLCRIGEPGDVAEMVHFLADERTARFITGHTYFVDGGAVKWKNPNRWSSVKDR